MVKHVMPWIELHATVPEKYADPFSRELSQLGALAVTFEDAGNQPIFEPTPDTPRIWPTTRVIGLFDSEHSLEHVIVFLEQQKAEGFIHHFHSVLIKEEDWERRCLDQFHPIAIGSRLWIYPSWHTPPDQSPEVAIVRMDPGLAFGTGTHPTTQLCLAWLEQHVKTGWTVIDYGCGSGILSIAAYQLGAAHVIAVDHDPQALFATQLNAERNHFPKEAISIQSPSKSALPKADLLIANILAEPLITLAPYFQNCLKLEGQIVLSGILNEQTDYVLSIYKQFFEMYLPNYKGDWALLSGFKPKP